MANKNINTSINLSLDSFEGANSFKLFCGLFPELTERQSERVVMYSLGWSLGDLAKRDNITLASIHTSLLRSAEVLEVYSVPSLRPVTLNRILFSFLTNSLHSLPHFYHQE